MPRGAEGHCAQRQQPVSSIESGDRPELGINQRLELLRTLGDWRDSAANRYWTRFNMLLLINSLFGAALFLSEKGLFNLVPVKFDGKFYPLGSLILSLAAVLFSYAWQQILRAGKYYEHRWYLDMKYLLMDSPDLDKFVHLYKLRPRKEEDSADGIVPPKRRSTEYAGFVVRGFLILWILLAIVVCWKFFRIWTGETPMPVPMP